MYVAVKGGERAIDASLEMLARERRGDPGVPELAVSQIDEQLSLAVDRVMTEGSLHDRELAALAIKQARGDLVEAIFLVRAYRTTLPRFGFTEPVDTGSMAVLRRISAAFKDIPGGQILGPSFDYTHRLLVFGLLSPSPRDATSATCDSSRHERFCAISSQISLSSGCVKSSKIKSRKRLFMPGLKPYSFCSMSSL